MRETALCPTPKTSGSRWGPAHPSLRPHLPRPHCQRPLPPSPRPGTRSHPRASRPRRPHPAHTPRTPRAEAAQPADSGGRRAGANRGGAGARPRARARPPNARRGQAGASPTYAVFLFLRGGPHGRAGRDPAGAAAARRQRGGDGRGPGCGAPRGEAGAVRRRRAVGGASLTGRPGCHRRHARTARFRGRPSKPDQRGRGFATCQSLPFSRHRSFLTAPLLGSRRRRDSARLSGLAGRPRMRRFQARGGSRCPGSRRPSPRANPRVATAARQRREIHERRLNGPVGVRTGS